MFIFITYLYLLILLSQNALNINKNNQMVVQSITDFLRFLHKVSVLDELNFKETINFIFNKTILSKG